MSEDPSARPIYQSVLDRLTAGILSDDADLVAQTTCLPFRARTPGGEIIYDEPGPLRQGMALYNSIYVKDEITVMERRCDIARFIGEDQIVGHHWTRGWRDDGSEMKPFASRMHLFRIDGDWKVGVLETAAKPSTWDEFVAAATGYEIDIDTLEAVDFEEPDLNVLQTVIDWVSTAFMGDDADGWISIVDKPLTLIRGTKEEVFETDDALRADFEHYRSLFRLHGVTDILRQAHEVYRPAEDVIEGVYTTYILRGANPILPPWKGRMTLRRHEDGFWRISRVDNALTKSLGTRDAPTEMMPGEARVISERLLHQTGEALLTRDFDLFADAFHLPHNITTINQRLLFKTRDDLRRAFERMSDTYRSDGGSELHRYVVAAEFKTPERIASTHMTHLMRGTVQTEDPFPVFSIIEHREGRWGVANSDYAFEADSPRGAALRAGDPTRQTAGDDGKPVSGT